MCRQSVVHHQLISSFEKIVVSNKTLYWLNILDSERKKFRVEDKMRLK
jgi:hypothetical protein